MTPGGGGSDPPDPEDTDAVVSEDARFEPVLEDEFEGAKGSAPPGHWSAEIGNGQWGWGNEQLEFDTGRAENVALDGDGHLVITARKESYGGFGYTSARLITRDGVEQKYGRVEIRVKLPQGQGLWPAFWMLGHVRDKNGGYVNWPDCGEIDILEFRGHDLTKIRSSLHGPGYSGLQNFGRDVDFGVDLSADFHTYGMTWSEKGISFDFDGERYFSQLKSEFPEALDWVFDHPFYLILNLAVGGKYLGDAQPTEGTAFPAELVVDYVRVFRIVEP